MANFRQIWSHCLPRNPIMTKSWLLFNWNLIWQTITLTFYHPPSLTLSLPFNMSFQLSLSLSFLHRVVESFLSLFICFSNSIFLSVTLLFGIRHYFLSSISHFTFHSFCNLLSLNLWVSVSFSSLFICFSNSIFLSLSLSCLNLIDLKISNFFSSFLWSSTP